MESNNCYLFYNNYGIMECVSEMNEIPENTFIKNVRLDKIKNYYTIYDCIHYDNRNKIIELDVLKKYYVLSMRQQQMTSDFIYLFDSCEKVEDFLYDGHSKIVYFEKEFKEYKNGVKEWLFHEIDEEDETNMVDEITKLERTDWMEMEKVDYDDENYDFYWRINVRRVN